MSNDDWIDKPNAWRNVPDINEVFERARKGKVTLPERDVDPERLKGGRTVRSAALEYDPGGTPLNSILAAQLGRGDFNRAARPIEREQRATPEQDQLGSEQVRRSAPSLEVRPPQQNVRPDHEAAMKRDADVVRQAARDRALRSIEEARRSQQANERGRDQGDERSRGR